MGGGENMSVGGGAPAAEPEEDLPWHDPALGLDERLAMAEGKPPARRYMAAMAQLDCGSCGYVCKTYAEAIASGEDKDLSKCTPGGRETIKMLKTLQAEAPKVEASTRASRTTGESSTPAKPAGAYDRANPCTVRLLSTRGLNGASSSLTQRPIHPTFVEG